MESIGAKSWICNLKPGERGKINLFGKEHDVPRWQQSYEKYF